jgi:hypothetical protein
VTVWVFVAATVVMLGTYTWLWASRLPEPGEFR